jgi:hypothetical protein
VRSSIGWILYRGWAEVSDSALVSVVPCPDCGKAVKLNPLVINADWRPVAAAWRGEAG